MEKYERKSIFGKIFMLTTIMAIMLSGCGNSLTSSEGVDRTTNINSSSTVKFENAKNNEVTTDDWICIRRESYYSRDPEPYHVEEYEYNEVGLLLTKTENIGKVTKYEYNENNKLSSEVTYHYNEEENIDVIETYEYDYINHFERFIWDTLESTETSGYCLKKEYDIEGKEISQDFIVNEIVWFHLDFIYNENGQVKEEIVSSNNGIIDSKTQYAYNNAGELIHETIYTFFEGYYSILAEYGYLYDKQGNISHIFEYENSQQTKSIIYENNYDEYGNLVCQVIYDDNKPITILYSYSRVGENEEIHPGMYGVVNKGDTRCVGDQAIAKREGMLEKIREYLGTYIVDYLYDDFDKNGTYEVCAVAPFGATQEHEGLNNMKPSQILYTDGDTISVVDTLWTDGETGEFSHIFTENIAGQTVCEVMFSDIDGVAGGTYCLDEREFHLIENETFITRPNGDCCVRKIVFPYIYDMAGNAYQGVDEWWTIPIHIVEGVVCEYSVNSIPEEDFKQFSNYDIALEQAKDEFTLKKYMDGVQEAWPISVVRAIPYEYLKAENSILYVNFYLPFTTDEYVYLYRDGVEVGRADQMGKLIILGSAEYQIDNDNLELISVHYGKKNIGNQGAEQEQTVITLQ